MLPTVEGRHRSTQHVHVAVPGPADLGRDARLPPGVRSLLEVADRWLSMAGCGDRTDRRPPAHRLPDQRRRVAREWQDDVMRWRPADDPCDGPECHLGEARSP